MREYGTSDKPNSNDAPSPAAAAAEAAPPSARAPSGSAFAIYLVMYSSADRRECAHVYKRDAAEASPVDLSRRQSFPLISGQNRRFTSCQTPPSAITFALRASMAFLWSAHLPEQRTVAILAARTRRLRLALPYPYPGAFRRSTGFVPLVLCETTHPPAFSAPQVDSPGPRSSPPPRHAFPPAPSPLNSRG